MRWFATLATLLLLACNVSTNTDDDSTDATDDDATSSPTPTETPTATPTPTPTPTAAPYELCYPGPNYDWSVCLPLVDADASMGADYEYPAPLDARYLAPLRYIDLSVTNAALLLAPNFQLDELMQTVKGQWAFIQPHALEKLQIIRTEIGGALNVNSGYRSPAYNASVGGASSSRHCWGDGFDMWANVATLTELDSICQTHGSGYTELYETHVHCDWRNDPLEPLIFDANPQAKDLLHNASQLPLGEEAEIRIAQIVPGDAWTAPVEGFDEGEPLRLWWAYDDLGRLVATGEGREFVPPEGSASIEVEVGGRIVLSMDP